MRCPPPPPLVDSKRLISHNDFVKLFKLHLIYYFLQKIMHALDSFANMWISLSKNPIYLTYLKYQSSIEVSFFKDATTSIIS